VSADFRFPIEYGNVLAFRRAIGQPDGDALTAPLDALAAPPTYVTAAHHFDPESRLRPREGARWVTAPSRDEEQQPTSNSRILHAEQHYEYHRPVRSGQVLTVSTREGETWTKEGRRGLMTFLEILTEYRDQDGELLVTGRAVRVELAA